MKGSVNVEKTEIYDRILTNKIIEYINPIYLETSQIFLKVNKGNSNSIRIKVDNNPWRNDQIKGDLTFAKVKSTGKVRYIAFKNKFAYALDKLGISYSCIKSDDLYIRVYLQELEDYINNNSEKAKELLNSIFLDSISFPSFGCCSKYDECTEQHRCLHCDPLYSTSCQYRKIVEM